MLYDAKITSKALQMVLSFDTARFDNVYLAVFLHIATIFFIVARLFPAINDLSIHYPELYGVPGPPVSVLRLGGETDSTW